MSIPDIQEALDLIEDGRPEEALRLLATLTERMPAYVAVHAVMARAHEAAEQWDAALAAWQRTRLLMPNSPAVRDGLQRVLAAMAPPEEEMPAERLATDLDLQAELDAALEAVQAETYNPFTRPPQSAEDALLLPEDDTSMSLAEASLALVEKALDEATTGPAEAPPPEPSAPEDPYADDPSAIYREIEQLIAERKGQKPPEDTAPVEAPEEAPSAPEQPVEATEQTRREEIVRRTLKRLAEAAPEEETGKAADAESLEDLDRLIQKLESARIVPAPDLEDIAPPSLEDDIDDVVSETLARIYATQEQYLEAARVYERLAELQPEQSTAFLRSAAEMRARAAGAEGEEPSDGD